MALMPLDLTGALGSNKVTGETKTITRDADRYFVPANGAIYDYNGSFKIYNAQSGALLQPNTQYRLLHLVEEAVKISNKNVYAVIYIVDKSITTVRYNYQAVGGVYQNIASVIGGKLEEYLLGTTGSNTIGNIVGVPVQVPPEHHIQSMNDFQGAGALAAVLENIRTSVTLGNGPAFSAAYEYIDARIRAAMAQINQLFADAAAKQAILETKSQIRDGDYIITSNPANPSSYLGYGNWVLDPNVLLYGADAPEVVGNLIDVGNGGGYVGIKRYFWRRNDAATGATYSLSASSTTVNEGSSVTVTLVTSGLDVGTKIAYTITGITANDLVSGSLNGNFVINASGVANLVLQIREDQVTEGLEIMKVALTAMPTVSVLININDTSIAPTYTLRFSGSSNGAGDISSVNEGSKAYLAVSTTGVVAGTRVYLLYNDSTVSTADSNTGAWPAYFDVTESGVAIVEYDFKADQLTEGVETIVVNACATNNINTVLARAVLTVNDTSKAATANILYSSNSAGTATITQANEGTTAYLFVNTTNIANGDFVDLAYLGTATAADFTNALPTRVTIQNNQAIVTLNIAADVKTEGDETLIVNALYNGTQLASKTLIIKDTSVNPSYSLKYSTNSSGTDSITRANEGQSVYLCVETTNVTDGTVLNVTYSGSADPANDLVNYPRTLTVVGNRASGVIIIKADQLTEGDETLIADVKNGTTSIGTTTLTITDTSASPTANIRFSTAASGGNTVTSTNEGTTIYAIIETTNIDNGTVLQLSHAGTATADDFVNARATSVTINGNTASITLQVKNDLVTEGSETYRLSATLPNGEVITSGALTINDTSVPSFNMYFSGNSNGTGQITNINEGQTAYLVIDVTGNIAQQQGTFVYTGNSVASDFDNANYGAQHTVAGTGRSIIPFPVANDLRTDGSKTLSISLTLAGISGSAQATITIADTSQYGRLTTSGNIVVPAGKVARIILMSGQGMANYNNEGGGYNPAISTLTVDGEVLHLGCGGNGSSPLNLGTFVMDGWDGTQSLYTRPMTDNQGWILAGEDYTPPANFSGMCQLLTLQNKHGGDLGIVKGCHLPKVTSSILNIIESMMDPVIAPNVNLTMTDGSVKQGKPGYGAGSPGIVLIYRNSGSTAVTIPVNLVNQPNPTKSGVRGQDATCFYEFFDTTTEADTGQVAPVIFQSSDLYQRTFNFSLKPNETYQITIVSGGGPSYKFYQENPSVLRGQGVTLYFGAPNSANNIVVTGGETCKELSEISGPGWAGSVTINGNGGQLPAYAQYLGSGGNDISNYTYGEGPNRTDMYSPIIGYAGGMAGIFPDVRFWPVMPFPDGIYAWGAPGFNEDNSRGVGGRGAAYSFLVTNTTGNSIPMSAVFTGNPATPALSSIRTGKCAAVVVSRINRK